MFKVTKTRGSGCKKGVITKKLKSDFCKKIKKSRLPKPLMSAQTSKESIMQCPGCDDLY